ncbi:hypothetical protein T10_9854 [Trichinella papuae]|uniref:Uncharacterized protein n=2 Tax=Trichinella papuae TaxID=268474 RepID=A0A0V1N258_9BILA|nr:hypothetical protein T10_9854 [Trichinella papuae]
MTKNNATVFLKFKINLWIAQFLNRHLLKNCSKMKKSNRPKQQRSDERTKKGESVGKRSTNLVHEISRYYKPVLGREEPWSTGSGSADRVSLLPSVCGPQSNVPEPDVMVAGTSTSTSRSPAVSSSWSTEDADIDQPRLERVSAKLACDQLKALLLNQRQEYRRKLALEKAKRRAVENLLLQERPSHNASRSSASVSTVDQPRSPLPQTSLDTTSTSTVSQSNKENFLHSSGDSDRWREVTLASRTTAQQWSASSIRSDISTSRAGISWFLPFGRSDDQSTNQPLQVP